MNSKWGKKGLVSNWRIILACLHYFVGYQYVYYNVIFYIGYWLTGTTDFYMYTLIPLDILVLVTTVALLLPYIKESWYRFKFGAWDNIKSCLSFTWWMFLTSSILSIVISGITGLGGSANQDGLNEIASIYPWLIIFASIVFAPIVEELIFRGIFYRHIRPYVGNGWATLISSVSFGLLHVYDSIFTGNYLDLVYIILFSAMGFILVKIYEETDSIVGSIIVHSLYNTIGVLLSFTL